MSSPHNYLRKETHQWNTAPLNSIQRTWMVKVQRSRK